MQEQIAVTARMPREWRDAIVEEAQTRGVTLTDWVCEHLLAGLPEDVRSALPENEKGRGRNLKPTLKQEAGE